MSLTLGPAGSSTPTESFVARLDRVPLNRFHWRLLVTSGVGWMFAAMDIALIAFLLVPIGRDLSLNAARTSAVATAALIGMIIGALVAGRLADRYGRQRLFWATLVVFSVGALLSAAAPTFETLLAARFIAGLGLGGELPVATTLLAEFAPRAQRGRLIVLLDSFWIFGALLAGLIAVALVPSYGWRVAFAVAAIPALYAAYLRSGLPESPRFLAERGRAADADAIVRRVERASGGALLTLGRAVAPARAASSALTSVLGRGYARHTAMLWLLAFAIVLTVYATFDFVASLRFARGLADVRTTQFFFASTLALVPAYLAAAWLVERLGRKATLILFLLAAGLFAVLFGRAGGSTAPYVYAALMLAFSAGAWGICYAYATELYPTSVRGTGAGLTAAVGRIGAIAGPFLIAMLGPAVSRTGIYAVLVAVPVLAALAIFALGDETRGRSIEDTARASM
ncbi:MAG TPA: MFS transporter [Candidatus Limnocylindrales bacterium]|nr:MFS transporter [Candidatus Limnocylindrales bacterium]